MHNMRRSALAGARTPPPMSMRSANGTSWARHVAVCLLISAATLLIMRWWAWAWAPAAIIGIIYLMYASLKMTEARSRALRDLSIRGPRPDTRSALVARERIGARILATLAIGFIAIALVVAALALDSRTLGLGTAMTFSLVVFIGLPTWAAVVGDDLP